MKRGTPLILSAALAAAAMLIPGPAGADEANAKVVQGRIATVGAYPAQVALVAPQVADNFQGQICGGTLIHPEWVLTAAHCLAAVYLPDVLLGTTRLDGSGTRIRSIDQRMHAGYDANTQHDDIGLLRLAAPVQFPIAALALPGMETLESPGATAVTTGWGTQHEDQSVWPVDLLEADLPIVADDTCGFEFARWGIQPPVAATTVCAGAGTIDAVEEQPGACYGDSGGPLWATGPNGVKRQIGVVNGGAECGFSPGVYASVASQMSFIEQATGLQFASFADIPTTPHEQNIERIALAGFAGGVGGGLYAPSAPVTRGQMATFLVRALGLAAAPTPAPFSDTAGHRHEADIATVAAAGLAGGFVDGTYKPDQPVARDQMATFLARAKGLAGVDTGPFVDTAGNAHAANINAVAAAGIAGGVGNGLYAPFDAVSRGQMATFLARAFLGA